MVTLCVESGVWRVGSQDNTLLSSFRVQAGGAAGVIHESSPALSSLSASRQSPDQVREAEPVHGCETRYGGSVTTGRPRPHAAPFPITPRESLMRNPVLLNILRWAKMLTSLGFVFAI